MGKYGLKLAMKDYLLYWYPGKFNRIEVRAQPEGLLTVLYLGLRRTLLCSILTIHLKILFCLPAAILAVWCAVIY